MVDFADHRGISDDSRLCPPSGNMLQRGHVTILCAGDGLWHRRLNIRIGNPLHRFFRLIIQSRSGFLRAWAQSFRLFGIPMTALFGSSLKSSPTVPGQIVLAGIILSLVGIFFCGWAGALRERADEAAPSRYSFRIGVPLAIMAGIFSAVFNFALLAGAPLEKAALEAGANDILRMNAIYPFSNGGAWVTNFIWCLVLIARNKTGSQLIRLPGKDTKTLSFYYLMALLSGAMWYFQFFFYGMGHVNMGEQYGFTSWALHMAMLILFSNLYGTLFQEWRGRRRCIL